VNPTSPELLDTPVGLDPYPPIIKPPSPALALALAYADCSAGDSGTVEVPICSPAGPREITVPESVMAEPPSESV